MNNTTSIEAGQHVKESYMPYAMSTILDRALPDVRDGLKPIHRRILYQMKKRGIIWDKDRAKTTEPTSETMKIHHHGDTSISDAIALMTEQNETLLHPYIDGEGSFGKVYLKDKPSAPRYTYCRLNRFSEEFFKDLNKEVLQMIGEDKEHMQPVVLSSSFPNIFIKNNEGIAVGEACDFPSFNLEEICNATVSYVQNKDTDLFDYIKGVDFSTGGYLVYDKESLKKIYDTGRGSVILRAKYKYDKENNCIDIYEIPYPTTVDAIVSKITELMKENKYKSLVLDVRDETGFNKDTEREELKITIDLKKNVDINKLMSNLFKDTTLQCSYSANMNCLVDYEPRVLGVKQILDEWLKFRKSCIIKSLQYDIKNKSEKLHLLKGLEKVLLNIDETIKIIRQSDEDKINTNLINKFSIDDIQASYISDMKLRNINKDYIIKQIQDIQKLNQEVENLKYKLNSQDEIDKIIILDLIRVRDTYGKPRKTEILYEDNLETISESELIEDYNCYISVSGEFYMHKYQRKSDTFKTKEGDEIANIFSCSNKSTLLVFTSLGNCYKLFLHDIDLKQPSTLGHYLPSLIDLEKDEKIISVQVIRKYENYLINVFESGQLAKIKLSTFRTEQKRTKLKNAISTESPLVNQFIITDDIDIIAKSSIDKILITNTSQFNAKGSKNSNGDALLRSKNDSALVLCQPLDKITGIEDIEYYRGKRNSIGCYLKKTDTISFNPVIDKG